MFHVIATRGLQQVAESRAKTNAHTAAFPNVRPCKLIQLFPQDAFAFFFYPSEDEGKGGGKEIEHISESKGSLFRKPELKTLSLSIPSDVPCQG